ALADASNKIKWSVNLRPNLDNLPDTQIVRFSSVLPWSDKFRESVKLDLDAKQGELEVPWCENFELVIPSQESRGRTSTWTARMASFTGCKNQARDFARAAKLPLEPTFVTVAAKSPGGETTDYKLPVQLPHKLLEYLLECGLHIEDGIVNSYWNHLDSRQDEWALSTADFRKLEQNPVWTLGFYGDEANVGFKNAPQSKVYGMFMSLPLFRPKAARLARYLICAIESDKVVSVEETFFPILDVVVQSFNMTAEIGVLGRRFLVSEIRGDQVWIRYLFRHNAFWRSTHVCFRCKACADSSPLSYMLYQSNDGWGETRRSTAEFITEELQYPAAGPLVDLHFFHISLIKHCTLHILNLRMLGVCNGSTLAMLLHMHVFGPIDSAGAGGYKDALNAAFDDFTHWTGICRYFGLTERASRALPLGSAHCSLCACGLANRVGMKVN
ncbi:unnamed protein product, partial [Effrenium voratum]